jgi:HrpA-like RNA helicase
MATLLEKNKIISQPWYSALEKKKIETMRSINYLVDWIDKRIWRDKNTPPSIPIKGIGNKVLVLKSATGSGKSTIIPPYLYNKYNEHGGRGIIITQPKVITTQSIPFDIISYNKNLRLGDNIGYQTGTLTKKNKNGILFCTVGILLQFLKTLNDKQFMSKYRFIIIDEVHERSIDLEIVLFYIKQLLIRMWKDSECPFVILMSGTLQPEQLLNYFECPKDNFIEVEGSSFPIEDKFANYDVSNYLDYIVDKICNIHINNIEDFNPQNDEMERDKKDSQDLQNKDNSKKKDSQDLQSDNLLKKQTDNLLNTQSDNSLKKQTDNLLNTQSPQLINGSFIIDESLNLNLNSSEPEITNSINNKIQNSFDVLPVQKKVKNTSVRDIMIFVQGQAQIKYIENKINMLNTEIFSKGYKFAHDYINNKPPEKEKRKHNKEKKGGQLDKSSLDNFARDRDQLDKSSLDNFAQRDQPDNFAQQNNPDLANPDLAKYYLLPISLMSDNIKQASKEYMNIFTDVENLTTEIYNFDEKDKPGEVIETYKVSRRVILATNSAETGLTINSLKYCIDSGYVKELMFCPTFNCLSLVNKNVTKNSSIQRRGRVGRKAPGVFHAVYTKETFDYMPVFTYPEIVKEDITIILLELIIKKTNTEILTVDVEDKNLYDTIDRNDDSFKYFLKLDSAKTYYEGKEKKDFKETYYQTSKFTQQWYKLFIGDVFESQNLDFIQYPSSDSMSYSLEKLHILGFIDHEFKPTLHGIYGIRFRKMKIENIKMILAGYYHGANILDLITISCCIQESNNIGIRRNKYKPRNPLDLTDQESKYYYKLVFADEFIEYLFIWNDFMKLIDNIGEVINKKSININDVILPNNYLKHWCDANSFKLQGLIQVIQLRDEVINDMMSIGLNPYYNSLEIPKGKYNLVNILNRNIGEGLEEIKKIKKCIYEGYKLNYCTWDANINKYISVIFHIPISIKNVITDPLLNNAAATTPNSETMANSIQIRPKHIVVSGFLCREVPMTKCAYEFTCGEISVLDNYVDVDPTFYQN